MPERDDPVLDRPKSTHGDGPKRELSVPAPNSAMPAALTPPAATEGSAENIPALAAIGIELGLGFGPSVDAQAIESWQTDREAAAAVESTPKTYPLAPEKASKNPGTIGLSATSLSGDKETANPSSANSLFAAIGAPARALLNTAQTLRSRLSGMSFGSFAPQTPKSAAIEVPAPAAPLDSAKPAAPAWPPFDRSKFEAQLPQGGLNAFWAAAISKRRRAQNNEFNRVASMAIFRQPPALRVGLVGSSNEAFDHEAARFVLNAIFDSLAIQWTPHAPASLALVGGLTDVGLCAIGYRLARDRSWSTRGVAAFAALSHAWFEVDQALFAGDQWGDESQSFLNEIDVLVRVGGGPQARREEAMARARGLAVLAIEF